MRRLFAHYLHFCECQITQGTTFLSALVQFIAPALKTFGVPPRLMQDAPRVSAVKTLFQVAASPEATT
jgi:hypothetical protein